MQAPAPPALPPRADQVLAALWQQAGLPPQALERITLTGQEPALPSSFALGTALQAALGAAALAAAELGRQRGGLSQQVSVDIADVVRESSGRFTLDGRPPRVWDKLSGLYRCGADTQPGWVRIHANFAHHRDGALALLGLPTGPATDREAVAAARRGWTAEAFEAAAAERGLVVAAVRRPQDGQRLPLAAAVAALPLVDITSLDAAHAPGRGPAARAAGGPRLRPLAPPGGGALGGLRVLDLTRILAGPVAGRTLAAYGADVLLVNSPHLPNIESIADTSRGKRSAHLDLRSEAGRAALRALVRECDVFLQGYRPGGLAALGFGPDELARLRPGIVCVSLSAYGHAGPWQHRRGFDSLVQSATGFNIAEAEAFGSPEPKALPLQALDYGAGFLLAFGALAALLRRQQAGGSHLVRVSLAGLGHWLQGLGRLPAGPAAAAPDEHGAYEETDSGFGRLRALPHAARFSHTPSTWLRPSMPPGSHPPAWADDAGPGA
ncbi:MAG: CoA transferase [Burkholderiales bacterium]|nr:CoA transferase [Burkholderiales bacterium]